MERIPALGVKILQGALVDSAENTVNLPGGRKFDNKYEIGMNSFIHYISSNSDQGEPGSIQDYYYYMQGKWLDGSPIVNDGEHGTTSGPTTTYMYTGDPESGEGWLDQNPADRRMMLSVGPYDMESWQDKNNNDIAELGEPGVQEIIAAVMVARGKSNLNSVSKLKNISKWANHLYNNNFKLEGVEKPEVKASERPNEIILSWDNNSEYDSDNNPIKITIPFLSDHFGETIYIDYDQFEVDDSTYSFYGYNIYQYSDKRGNNPVLVDHYEIDKNGEYNSQRYIRITKNHNPLCGEVNTKLANGYEYYLGVVAELYNQMGDPKKISSDPAIISVTPHNQPGIRFNNKISTGDTVATQYHQKNDSLPKSSGNAYAIVIDKSKITGHDYKISFNIENSWNLIDLTESDTILNNRTNQSDNDAYKIVDGLMVKVKGPRPGLAQNRFGDFYSNKYGPDYVLYDQNYLKGWDFTSGRWITGADLSFGLTFWNGLANGYNFRGTSIESGSDYVDTELRWAGVETSDTTLSIQERVELSREQNSERWSVAIAQNNNNFAQSKAVVPFSAWDIENNKRLKIGILEFEDNGRWDFGEYIFILNEEYDTNYTDYLNGNKDISGKGNNAPVMYVLAADQRYGYPYLEANFLMEIYRAHTNTPPNDYFTFTAPAGPTDSIKNQKEDMALIKAVPNPYYGYRDVGTNDFERSVQFTNLPDKCIIMIFDLAGNKVWEYKKASPEQSLLKWNLTNSYGNYVASGVYIYIIKTKDLGEKIGKMAIFRRK